ncbi:putative zinc finger protein 385C-like [Scophthalmus maximus]|uniref:Putative zinc finger protein 385C-like n=1 Tax=Scophthalmus maximus TaxID=52904 RepID=A0A2U9CRI6_SCOMX|nr:putative zinc finger protein 385C-like [Scophthalmus maximus]
MVIRSLYCNNKIVLKVNRVVDDALPGTSAQGSSLLASLPVPGRPLQPQLDLKHLLPFRLNGSSPLSLFPNFNTMDPVQKAVINHTFGVPQPLKKKQIISCNICHLRFNSTNQAEAHYKGHKHARKLKAMEAQRNRQRRSGEASSAGRERDRDRDRGKTSTSEAALPALMDTSSAEGTAVLSVCLRIQKLSGFPPTLDPRNLSGLTLRPCDRWEATKPPNSEGMNCSGGVVTAA